MRCKWPGVAVLCVVVGLVALSTALRAAPATAGHKWALLVGVDRYERPDVTSLRFAVADVRAVYKTLQHVAGFPADHMFLLTSDQQGDGAPTRANLAFRLNWLAQRVKPADTVVFFFSGHGVEMGGTSYLLTREADPRDAATLEETGLPALHLRRMLGRLSAQHLLVFVDACRNDPRAGKGAGDNPLGQRLSRDLVLVDRAVGTGAATPVSATFFACSPGQRSYEWPDRKHGFFSYALIAGFEGRAAGPDGRVTVQSLMEYLDREVPHETERVLNLRQVPWTQAEGAGMSTWTLARYRRTTHAPALHAVAPATPLSVKVSFPASGYATSRPSVTVAATITGGGAVSQVALTVNGRAVPLAPAALQKGSQGAALSQEVPLGPGENTIVVSAMSESGMPAQAVVQVERPGGAAPPVEVPSPHQTSPQPASSVWSVEPGRGVGPFRIGMARSDAIALVRQLGIFDDCRDYGHQYSAYPKVSTSPNVQFFDNDGIVYRIYYSQAAADPLATWTLDPPVIGATQGQVAAWFGTPTSVSPATGSRAGDASFWGSFNWPHLELTFQAGRASTITTYQ